MNSACCRPTVGSSACHPQTSGFSLMELLIVVGVMAALVGLAMPFYSDYIAQSEVAVMKTNLKALRKALMEYRTDHGSYPLTADVGILATTTLGKGYLLDFPKDPMKEHQSIATWGYKYPPTNGTEYELDPVYSSVINE
ncbi:type II secretion system protein GspG [Candidatus Ozemobacteraceae bacterium]|nr:type II secretion system protein GspG [Candidatus Ozemobacteraceae bacterium]